MEGRFVVGHDNDLALVSVLKRESQVVIIIPASKTGSQLEVVMDKFVLVLYDIDPLVPVQLRSFAVGPPAIT